MKSLTYKKVVVFLLMSCCLSTGFLCSQTLPNSETFETGWGIWVDGGDDCFRDGTSKLTGTYSINLQDNSGSASSMTTENIDLSTYGSVAVSFDFITVSMESGEDFFVRYSSDGGTNWATVTSYVSGTDFSNNIKYSRTVNINSTSYPFTASSKFRIQCDAGDNDDDVFIDNVEIVGQLPVPEINITGNDMSIASGDVSPDSSDNTNFGSHSLNTSVTKTFTIENIGGADLTIANITGGGIFTITPTPFTTTVVPAGTSTIFTVTGTPVSIGTFSATIIVTNDDADESSYEFLVEIIGEEVFFDSDGDGVLDNNDIDDDNDGIKDTDEEVACRNSSVSTFANYKFLNETFGTGSRTTINATYGEANTTYCYEDGTVGVNTADCPTFSDYSLNDGEYTVGLSAQIASWAAAYWYVGGDHTGDTNGRMALFNASYEPGIFYTASIKGALPNVPITYSFWVINLDRTDAPGIATRLRPNILVEFRDVNNNLLESIVTGDIAPTSTGNSAGDWYNFSADLILNVNEFYVYFYNNETGGLGNDLALDDIVISQNLCDTDSDGVADVFDLDSDNDGIPDIVECGLGSYSEGTAKIPYPASWVDVNSNGMLDAVESNVPLDSDGDGVPNQMDLDSDNDGIFDVDESGVGNVNAAAGYQNGDGDITGDGVGDGPDTDAFRDTDIDSDGILEHFTDGILDIYDYFNGSDFATSYGNIDQGSPTSSGWYDYVVDSDNDGLPDYIDLYSNDATNSLTEERDILTTLYANLDANNDGVIDGITDTDGDGLLDAFDTNDAAFGSPRDLDRKLELYFDGRNDYADDVPSVLSGLSEATLMGWIKIDPLATGDQILFGQDNFYLKLLANKKVEAKAGIKTVSTTLALTMGQWIHVAATYSTSNLKLYINGELISSTAGSGALSTDTSSFTIGRNPDTNSNYYHGYFDEIRVFDKALTDDELHKMVYQEIEENAGNVWGFVIPRTITNYVNTTTSPVVLPWSHLKRYFRMDVYKDDIIDDLTTGTMDVGSGAKIYNMKIIDPQTAPLPFVTQTTGTLPVAVDIPADGVKGTDAITYDWSIVEVQHDITYNADQKHLGLIVENPNKFSIQNNTELNVTWYLELDGFIDLEEESQLVQGDDSLLDQDSGGYIERDQQGTANSFNYNYWSSAVGPITPSGIGQRGTGVASTNANYNIGNILMDGSDPGIPNKNGAISFGTPYAFADAGITSPIKISTYWLFTFNGTHDDYNSWNSIDQNTGLFPGEGYTMKGTSGSVAITTKQNYVFKGKPYNGDFTLQIDAGDDRLIGNPYPSAMDVEEFIKDNLSISDGFRNAAGNIFNGALYFWDHFGEINTHILREYVGGYATRNLIGGTEAISNDYRINANLEEGVKIPGQYISVNQGFFVTAVGPVLPPPTIDGGQIVFKNSQRVFETEAMGNSVFMKGMKSKPTSSVGKSNTKARPKIWLLFHSPSGYHRQLLVGVHENTSNNFDIGYDAPIADVGIEDMFWIIDGGKFVIQGVSNFEADQELPLGLIINKTGLAQIKIDSLENIAKTVSLYIKDHFMGETYEITKNPFEINLEPGTYANRFSLAFQPRLKSLEEIALSDGFQVYMDQLNCEIQVKKMVDTEIKSIKLINSLGQIINSWHNNLEEINLSLPINVSIGMYLVQINTKNGSVVKKVIVE